MLFDEDVLNCLEAGDHDMCRGVDGNWGGGGVDEIGWGRCGEGRQEMCSL